MSRMPGVLWVPLPRFSTTRMSAHNIICIHTMVGSLMGTDSYFRSITTGVNSHYGTGGAGEPIRQWGDTAFRSGANLDGNGDCITIEDADMGPGFGPWDTADATQVPPFTDLQCEDIARILAWESSPEAHAACPASWACHQVGIPLDLIPDSRPGRRGVGYHRQGIDPYRVADGVKWSSKYAKACPTDHRFAQIPQIIARAHQIRSGVPEAPPQEDDMPQAIVQPGQAVILPNPYPDVDLLVAVDNPTSQPFPKGDADHGILRIAVQTSLDPTWERVGGPRFPVFGNDPYTTRVPLGLTGQQLTEKDPKGKPLRGCLSVSVLNKGDLPATVMLAPHPANA